MEKSIVDSSTENGVVRYPFLAALHKPRIGKTKPSLDALQKKWSGSTDGFLLPTNTDDENKLPRSSYSVEKIRKLFGEKRPLPKRKSTFELEHLSAVFVDHKSKLLKDCNSLKNTTDPLSAKPKEATGESLQNLNKKFKRCDFRVPSNSPSNDYTNGEKPLTVHSKIVLQERNCTPKQNSDQTENSSNKNELKLHSWEVYGSIPYLESIHPFSNVSYSDLLFKRPPVPKFPEGRHMHKNENSATLDARPYHSLLSGNIDPNSLSSPFGIDSKPISKPFIDSDFHIPTKKAPRRGGIKNHSEHNDKTDSKSVNGLTNLECSSEHKVPHFVSSFATDSNISLDIESSSDESGPSTPQITVVSSQELNNNDKRTECNLQNKELETENQSSSNTSPSLQFQESGQNVSGKGNNWLQSFTDVPRPSAAYEEGKKGSLKVMKGGLAEKMQKLQRREKSDKTLWDHKIDGRRQKGLKTSMSLTVLSVQHLDEFVVTRCLGNSHDTKIQDANEPDAALPHYNADNTAEGEVTLQASEKELERLYFVLFRKHFFCRLQLKKNDSFRLFQPWQELLVPSLQYPVIVCAYFIDIESSSMDDENTIHATNDVNKSEIIIGETVDKCERVAASIQSGVNFCNEFMFYRKWWKPLSFPVRLQRIWEHGSTLKTSQASSFIKSNRWSMLLQTSNCNFFVLRLSSCDGFPWPVREGHCYNFCGLRPTYQMRQSRFPQFFHILDSILQQQNEEIRESVICYQLMPIDVLEAPVEIDSSDPPTYCPVKIEPLRNLAHLSLRHHFSCVAKMVFRYGCYYYLWDPSLIGCEELSFVRLQFLTPFYENASLVGSTVVVKEATFDGDCLLIEKFSKLSVFDYSSLSEELDFRNGIQVKEILDIDILKIIENIHPSSKVGDFVRVTGKIIKVDMDHACTYLLCPFCEQTNLLEDATGAIYCSDCFEVICNPILQVHLKTILDCSVLQATVQLLSTTIKRFLGIKDHTIKPHFCVTDILGKEFDNLICYVEKWEEKNYSKMFFVTEVDLN